jgi:SAM-dependent methyltransferase
MISYSIRRIALMGHFSRSPLAGSNLAVRRLPPEAALSGELDGVLDLSVTEWSAFRQTLFLEFLAKPLDGRALRRALVVFSSCAVEIPIAAGGATNLAVPIPATHLGKRVGLAFELDDGSTVVEWEPGARALQGDAAAELFARFQAELRAHPSGTVLELGARARSGNDYRHVIPGGWSYTGLDVMAGPNVDVVGDAHDLSSVLGDRRFDAVFSVSVFEHLLMPWKVVLEVNAILEPGGLLFIATHQTYPLHDEPWDFWRFSDRAWLSLLNPATGFEIVQTALGEPASVVPVASSSATWNLKAEKSFLLSTVLARKTGDATVEWPVDAQALVASEYPE